MPVTFDEFTGNGSMIPNGYQCLSWINTRTTRSAINPNSGFITALSSGEYVAFNGGGNPMSIVANNISSVGSFNIRSFIAAAAWFNTLILTMTGERMGTIVYNRSLILQQNTSTNIVLNWNNIDKITFVTSNGTDPQEDNGDHFAMDNLYLAARHGSFQ